ncbi:MAG: AAA family ATPase, partial [Aestuariibacter sp.]|nr:AAA family ATPase [Aestuariibacter sp.]
TLEPAEAERRVLEDKASLFVCGIAGTGKTHYMQGIVERLQRQGVAVEAVSKTHVASKRASDDGKTLDHWVRRHLMHGSPKCDVLWIDEVFQTDAGLLAQLSKLTGTMRFLLSGDVHQFAPLGNTFRGAAVPEDALLRSNLLHTMAGGNRVELTECRRSDTSLFEYYASLIPGGLRFELPLVECVRQAKTAFAFRGLPRWSLCISHAKRVRINREVNERLAPQDAVRLVVSGRAARGNAAQTMLLWPGIVLIGCTQSGRVRNGCLYEVEHVDGESVKLCGVDAALTHEQASKTLRLSFAQTYASCQGTE